MNHNLAFLSRIKYKNFIKKGKEEGGAHFFLPLVYLRSFFHLDSFVPLHRQEVNTYKSIILVKIF
jgi:hypothetical protein